MQGPSLPWAPDDVDEVAAGVEKQAKKVMAKNRRNSKLSQFGKDVVDLKEGLHILLQDDASKLFNIEAQVIRVCKGGRSAYVQGKYKGGLVTTYLRNRRFMVVDPKYRVEDEAEPEWAMTTGEVEIARDSCLPVKRLSRKAKAALRRTKTSVSGIPLSPAVKGTTTTGAHRQGAEEEASELELRSHSVALGDSSHLHI